MNSSSCSSGGSCSEWQELPSDILRIIATLLGPTLGLLRLRSICHPWRISLPLSVSLSDSLSVPSPFSLSDSPLSLRPRLLFLFTPAPPPPPLSDAVRILGFGDGINYPGPITNNDNCGRGRVLGFGDRINDPGPSTNNNNSSCGGARILGFGDGIKYPDPNNDNCGGGRILGFGDGINDPGPNTNNNNCGGATILGFGDGIYDPGPSTNNNNSSCGGARVLGSGVGPTLETITTSNNNNNNDNNNNNGFLVNVEQITPEDNNRFRLLTPLSSEASFEPNSSLNLLDFGIMFVSVSYELESCGFFMKVVVSGDFMSAHGDLVVLGLKAEDGRLLSWKQGDKSWTPVICHVRIFNDIASHSGKFYATADDKGRLVVIDVIGERAIDIVSNLMYGSGFYSSLIGCDAGLYLVDRISDRSGERVNVEVFKLDEKGRFWDYEFDLNDCVFFLGDDVNLWLSRQDYRGDVRNVIYFHDHEEVAKIWDMKTRSMCSLVNNEMCRLLFSPPSKYLNEAWQ